ncbi:unnamed protein product [Amoebophrya sp. A120]|nr:unnamed protein product [Amoebophrya sp. A120]|eukprot:GSA120T00011263001.1
MSTTLMSSAPASWPKTVPFFLYRSGTSRGAYFLEQDLESVLLEEDYNVGGPTPTTAAASNSKGVTSLEDLRGEPDKDKRLPGSSSGAGGSSSSRSRGIKKEHTPPGDLPASDFSNPADEVPLSLQSRANFYRRRDQLIARIMGSGVPQNLQGLGGGSPVTTKACVVGRYNAEDETQTGAKNEKSPAVVADLAYEFFQCGVKEAGVDHSHGDCGNMLAAVAAFGIEKGLVELEHCCNTSSATSHEKSRDRDGVTSTSSTCPVRLYSRNSKAVYTIEVPVTTFPIADKNAMEREDRAANFYETNNVANANRTSYKRPRDEAGEQLQAASKATTSNVYVRYTGDFQVPGVPSPGAPTRITSHGVVGTQTNGELFPTGNVVDAFTVEKFLAESSSEDSEDDEKDEDLFSAARPRRSLSFTVKNVTCIDFARALVIVGASELAKFPLLRLALRRFYRDNFFEDEENTLASRCIEFGAVDDGLYTYLEQIRLAAALKMGMGDCRGKDAPKVALLLNDYEGKQDNSDKDTPTPLKCLYFVNPGRQELHPTCAMTAGQALAAAALIPGTLPHRVQAARLEKERLESAVNNPTAKKQSYEIQIEHAKGVLGVEVGVENKQQDGQQEQNDLLQFPYGKPETGTYTTTVRLLSRGEYVLHGDEEEVFGAGNQDKAEGEDHFSIARNEDVARGDTKRKCLELHGILL